MMSGSKAHDFDTYGLFRASHCHNPTLVSLYNKHYTILPYIISRSTLYFFRFLDYTGFIYVCSSKCSI